MIFTGSDKALLDRAARMLTSQAKAVGWESFTEPRTRRGAKLEFDRLTRDARDLRALGKRLAPPKPAKVPKPRTSLQDDLGRINPTVPGNWEAPGHG